MAQSTSSTRFFGSLTQEGQYRLLIEAITDYAFYLLDADGLVSSWNLGAQRFEGYEEAEIIGQHFSRFYTEEDRVTGLPARALAAAARDGKFAGEAWQVRKDGARFWARVTIDPIDDPEGNLVGYIKITQDLTDRKAAETSSSSRGLFKGSAITRSLCLTWTDGSQPGTPVQNGSRATAPLRLSANISHDFTRRKIVEMGNPNAH